MAELKFMVISILSSLKERSIFIDCSMDIFEDTVTPSTIYVVNKTTDVVQMFDTTVVDKTIQVKLREDPQPGDKYLVIVQKGIKDIMEDYTLESAVIREITFQSEVTSDITITAPQNFERIPEAFFKWEETGKKLENKYEIQISTENAFFNTQLVTKVNDINEFKTLELEPGQYYIRIRAINGDQYGRWSEITTFIYEKKEEPTEEPPAEEPEDDPTIIPAPDIDDDIVIEVEVEELKLDETPDNGVTPKDAFSFAFSEDIDISEADFKVYRSDF